MANHWSWILSMKSDFWIKYVSAELQSAEYDWFCAHYDVAISGTINEHKSRNASIKQYPYALLWTVIQPGEEEESITSTYNNHMAAWYVAHPAYTLENAFLHNYSGGARKEITIWGSKRYVMNPKDSGLIAYQSARLNEICTTAIGGYYPDGVFIDEHHTTSSVFQVGDDYVEYHASGDYAAQMAAYNTDETSLITAIKTVIGSNKRMLLNTSSYINQINIDWIIAAGGAQLESMNSAFLGFGNDSYYGFIDTLLAQDVLIDFSGQPWGENPSGMNAGNSDSIQHRHDLWKLASYYTIIDTTASKLAFSTGDCQYPAEYPASARWIAAIETNVGHPAQVRQSYQTGIDGTGKNYIVYSRDMDNALILNRPMYSWSCTIYDDTTSVSVALPEGTWYPLASDGTLGAAIISINLRNSEGAILMKDNVDLDISVHDGIHASFDGLS